MSSFEVAWDSITKMPIVSGSFKEMENEAYDDDEEDDMTIYEAKFLDPKSKDILPLIARFHHPHDSQQSIQLNIGEDWRSAANIVQDSLHSFIPNTVDTDSEYRRRGYATALYDIATKILQEHDSIYDLNPSNEQSDAAKALWANQKNWQIRGDF